MGKVFTFLTVTDVIQSVDKRGKKGYFAICKSQCGAECFKRVYDVIRGHNKSCGCYESSKENSDRHRDISIRNREHLSIARKLWCSENRGAVKEAGRKRSEWCRNNPDKTRESAQKLSDWYKKNPDKAREKFDKIADWHKNNRDETISLYARQQRWRHDYSRVLRAIEKQRETLANSPEISVNAGIRISQWYKNNPDIVKRITDARKEYFVKNPEKVLSLSDRAKQWFLDNPDKLSNFRDAHQVKFLEDRLVANYDKLMGVIHPIHIDDLLSGKVLQTDSVLTKCPACGEYDTHILHNVFTLNKADFKTGHAPLCRRCCLSYTTSRYEDEIASYISSFYIGNCVRNTKEVIPPLELDLYYPEKLIAVEFNGDYWHSSIFKEKDYHYNKFISCRANGVVLVSVFEHHWKANKEGIKKYLHDLFVGGETRLSYDKDGYMNNNYPALYIDVGEIVLEDCYPYNGAVVYTCGYSKLLTN